MLGLGCLLPSLQRPSPSLLSPLLKNPACLQVLAEIPPPFPISPSPDSKLPLLPSPSVLSVDPRCVSFCPDCDHFNTSLCSAFLGLCCSLAVVGQGPGVSCLSLLSLGPGEPGFPTPWLWPPEWRGSWKCDPPVAVPECEARMRVTPVTRSKCTWFLHRGCCWGHVSNSTLPHTPGPRLRYPPPCCGTRLVGGGSGRESGLRLL